MIVTCSHGASGTYLDIEEVFGEDGRTVVDGLTLSIELATKHLSGDGHLQHVTGELTVSVRVVNIGSAFEDLSKQQERLDTCQLIKRGRTRALIYPQNTPRLLNKLAGRGQP